MRRLFIIAAVALLGLAPLGGFFVSAQESADSAYWNDVSAPETVEDPAPLEEFLVGTALDDPDVSRQRSINTDCQGDIGSTSDSTRVLQTTVPKFPKSKMLSLWSSLSVGIICPQYIAVVAGVRRGSSRRIDHLLHGCHGRVG